MRGRPEYAHPINGGTVLVLLGLLAVIVAGIYVHGWWRGRK